MGADWRCMRRGWVLGAATVMDNIGADVETLAKLETVPLLAALRKIKTADERRRVTREVHASKMAQWRQHDNWSFGMARHLVEDVHVAFRDGFARVRDAKDVKLFERWNSSLHHHHSLEDRSLFPARRKQHPELVPEVDILEKDHAQLVKIEKEVGRGHAEQIETFVALLLDHLDREELITVPVFLQGHAW